ncbi:MAG: LysM peptidoglycan-binding domain-containing protein [Planctomycetota bacterium]|jgi:hypothetical protein
MRGGVRAKSAVALLAALAAGCLWAAQASAAEAGAAPSVPAGESAREYVVMRGDTLSRIAREQLGSMRMAPLIVIANPSISDPDRIFAGRKLVIPRFGRFVAGWKLAGIVRLLRVTKGSRAAYVGLHAWRRFRLSTVEPGDYAGVEDPLVGRSRYVVVRLARSGSEVVFDSETAEWPIDHKRLYGIYSSFDWEAVDLDEDGDLDLVASRSWGTGGNFAAYAFHHAPDGYKSYTVCDGISHGHFGGRRPPCKDGTIAVDSCYVDMDRDWKSCRYERGLYRCVWTGNGFEVTKEGWTVETRKFSSR